MDVVWGGGVLGAFLYNRAWPVATLGELSVCVCVISLVLYDV